LRFGPVCYRWVKIDFKFEVVEVSNEFEANYLRSQILKDYY
jgi:hypothetical protein